MQLPNLLTHKNITKYLLKLLVICINESSYNLSLLRISTLESILIVYYLGTHTYVRVCETPKEFLNFTNSKKQPLSIYSSIEND